MASSNFLSTLLLLPLSLYTALSLVPAAEAGPKVPALYVFGDSTADVGNNNFLPGAQAKANFPHYGLDFPLSRPTGRFSNGYNGIDFLAMHMGFRRSPPPFLYVASKISMNRLKGVNFASGGSGILDSTGSTITMTEQIRHFRTIQSNLSMRMTIDAKNLMLSKSIFLISTGGNDIFGYFSQNKFPNATQKQLFIATLVSACQGHLEEMYNLGARKFAIVDVPPIGCCPYPRSLNPTGGCIEALNDLALGFNKAIKVLLQNLSLNLRGMKYSIGSSYEVVSNIIKKPYALGFKEVKTACCGSGKFNGEGACMPNATYCSDRRGYLFWDMLHPTHATSKLAGFAIYHGSLQFAAPINIRQLVEASN
ncbi:uncharacterized protein A4U43_C04F25530 [Asparagus officinalis]|uniref:GDSL esterase/lipase n=1 Tax=Asparagus officinalis TaxID=4686 RepID=A0A5P1F3J9_ASPOF|nr:GDSL esterase/lipase At5g55050-like [Asparagus officinalis]ONK72966.1 uncharacterized protein A4U43_C04F25530 [Asparagus officinalis]